MLSFFRPGRYTEVTAKEKPPAGARKEHRMENRIADQIRFYRKQKGLTQEQLAEAMGVSVAAVSKWEQGGSLR